MKKKVLSFIIMFIVMSLFCNFLLTHTADAKTTDTKTTDTKTADAKTANPTPTVTPSPVLNKINIKQYPTKTIYYKGESLDLKGMILEGYYDNGTVSVIKNYKVTGFDSNVLGNQNIVINYQGLTTSISVTVIPPKVVKIKAAGYSTSSVTLKWTAVPGAIRYEIYGFSSASSSYCKLMDTQTNKVTLYYPSASSQGIQICAVLYEGGVEYKGDFSDIFVAATAPEAVSGLNVTENTADSVSLYWNPVAGATGYIVYRASSTSNNYKACKEITSNTYTDKSLASGTGYKYKIAAYTYSKNYYGTASNIVDISTKPAKMVLKCKPGESKARITWASIKGASNYNLYMKKENSNYSLVTTRKASSECSYVIDNLDMGSTYYFYAVANRDYNGEVYTSEDSSLVKIQIQELAPTSTTAKIYTTEKDFVESVSFTKIDFFKKNVMYSESFVIPGLINTNVGGFSSESMCPQAIAFAGNYLLQTSYDKKGEENSVIYVMDKTTKQLVTTIILPSKAHVGGIAYDGTNVWVTRGKSLSSLHYSDLEAAVASGKAYVNVKFTSTSNLNITASYITFYNDRIWVGTYDEKKETTMYSYTITNKDTVPVLTKAEMILMPNRVQGVAFTDMGTLILSRSCQQYLGLRGYLRQLDVYNIDLTNAYEKAAKLGDPVNVIEMPSMNEGIAIDGFNLYVTFESAAFDLASFQMDRICAFKLTSLDKTGIDMVKK